MFAQFLCLFLACDQPEPTGVECDFISFIKLSSHETAKGPFRYRVKLPTSLPTRLFLTVEALHCPHPTLFQISIADALSAVVLNQWYRSHNQQSMRCERSGISLWLLQELETGASYVLR